MRILQLHCDNISYKPTKKEIKSAEEIDPKPVSIDHCWREKRADISSIRI